MCDVWDSMSLLRCLQQDIITISFSQVRKEFKFGLISFSMHANGKPTRHACDQYNTWREVQLHLYGKNLSMVIMLSYQGVNYAWNLCIMCVQGIFLKPLIYKNFYQVNAPFFYSIYNFFNSFLFMAPLCMWKC